MPLLTQGKVIVTNWHVFEPQGVQHRGRELEGEQGRRCPGDAARWIVIGAKTTTARGIALPDPDGTRAAGRRRRCSIVIKEDRDRAGNLKKVLVESETLRRERHGTGQPRSSAARSAASRTSW